MADQSTTRLNETNAPLVTGIAIGFVCATAIFVTGRFYTRGVLLRSIGKDDWCMLIATSFSVIYSIAMSFEAKYGMGRHVEAVGPAESLEQLKFLMVAILHYNLGLNVVKLGFLFQYRRIFHGPVMQKICLCGIICVCLWACAQAVLLGLACLPVSIIVPSMASSCLPTLPIWYFSSGMNMATDVLICCIPIPSVLKLQLPLRQRIMVLGVFCLGFFVCIISIYRIFTLKAGVISQDPSWDNVGVAIWSCIELNVSIIASTLPVLRPLIARLLPGIGLSSARNDRTTYLRYGSDSAAIRGGAGKSTTTGNRSNKMRSISTEELALKEMGPGVAAAGAGSMRPGSVHAAHASSGGPRSTGGFPKDEYDDSRIVRTMEILVDSHAR